MSDEIPDVEGTVDEFKTETITTKMGKPLPKFTIVIAGRKYTGIGTPTGIAKNDLVVLKLVNNNNFVNVSDILKNGVSILPKKPPFQMGNGGSNKATLVLAAVTLCCHNSAGTGVELADVENVAKDLKALSEKL